MTERDDEFEKRLERDLREWTDPATQPSNWTDEARALIAAGGPAAPSRWRLLALGASAVVLAGAAAAALVNLLPETANLGESPSPIIEPSGSAGPSPSVAVEPTPTPPPSTIPAAELPLSELAWWNLQSYGYGYFEPPPPEATPPPEGGHFVRIGTLDGHVSAELRLNPDWSHSSVSGPVGTDVLVANDDGAQTSVFVVSAIDGSRTDLFATPYLVPAAILSWDGTTVYYVKADRSSGADVGLWSRGRDGIAEAHRVGGPLGEPIGDPFDDITRWWLTLSPDGGTIVVQWCWGEVECRTHIVDLTSGDRREATGAGWPLGITDSLFVADGVHPHDGEVVTVDLVTGETKMVASRNPARVVRLGNGWWLAFGEPVALIDLVPGPQPIYSIPNGGSDRPVAGLHSPEGRFGLALPAGWILTWMDAVPLEAGGYLPGQLVNIATGERLDVGPFAPLGEMFP